MTTTGEIIENKTQLIKTLECGNKPKADWRIGTEHEKFVYDIKDYKRLSYDGEPGIKQLLQGLGTFDCWEPIYEGENIIALSDGNGASVSLEPGGQLELSGAPVKTIHETCAEVTRHLTQAKEICGNIGASMIGLGFDPLWQREDISWMPKGRYKIMRQYMPKRGTMGLDMMLRTSTVQVNLDFSSEADMVAKMRLSVALQPLATALFASSPFKEGKLNGYKSLRSHIWTDTDNQRCGMLPFVFDDGFGFEAWVDYLLDVPMYFIYRDGIYHDVAGKSFRDYMAGDLEEYKGKLPTMQDWQDHMTTAFPEVRLKSFIEMRGADAGPWGNLCALPAFWVGLLYDQGALDAGLDLIKDWTIEEMSQIRDDVPMHGLDTKFRNGTLHDLAREILAISRAGLISRQQQNWSGELESHFLDPLDEIIASGQSLSDKLIEQFNGQWHGNMDKLFNQYNY